MTNLHPPDPPPPPSEKPTVALPLGIGAGLLAVLAAGALLLVHAESKTNKVALSAEAKPVTVVSAVAAPYHATRTYVGRIDPWIGANVGPQLVSAYVDTVLVRPGAAVKKGQVLATLDCRNASATQRSIAMQARALDEQQRALAHESSRVTGLLDGGFVSPNEAEQKSALSAAKQSEVLATQAKLAGTSLEVNDCVLRAPFDGDVATRTVDPGAFVRPGMPIVSVVDRSTVRMTADVPENDFDVVAPDTKVRVFAYATGKEIDGAITRRAPAADPGTRTVHVEVDIPDPTHAIPVGTTGEVRVDVGMPVPGVEIPLSAAAMRDDKATLFVVDGDVAHVKTLVSLGEGEGALYARPADLPPGTRIVTEGRALLRDGDRVAAKTDDRAAMAPDGSVADQRGKP